MFEMTQDHISRLIISDTLKFWQLPRLKTEDRTSRVGGGKKNVEINEEAARKYLLLPSKPRRKFVELSQNSLPFLSVFICSSRIQVNFDSAFFFQRWWKIGMICFSIFIIYSSKFESNLLNFIK